MGTNKSLIQLIIEAIGAKKATDEIDGIGKKGSISLTNLGASMQKTGMLMTVGLTAPIVAGFAKMIDSASDMSETVNKVNVVFGDAAQEVLDFGKDAARGLGMSQQTALEAAGTFGNLLTSAKLTREEAAKMSTTMLGLSSDIGSFNNIDPTIALGKLRAGLIGEYEPLRSVGVALSEAAVELKGVELGLVSTGEEMTTAEKIQARYALIMEQTTNAQGDFARTSDGLANSSRILKAELEDVVAEMGQNLLPMALSATKFIGDLVGKFGDMTPAGQKAVLAFLGIAAALGPVLTIGGKLLTMLPLINTAFLTLAANPVVLVVAGLAAIGYSIYTLIEHNDDLVESTDEVAGHFEELQNTVRDTQRRFEEYRTVIEGLSPGTFAMNEAHDAAITTLHGEDWAMAALNATVIENTGAVEENANVFGGLFAKYNDVEGAQQRLIDQGIQMIDGLGAQARATALLAYWNGELTLAEYNAAVQQSFSLDTMQQFNEALDNGTISQLTWMAAMSDGVVTTEELNDALNNGTAEVEGLGDALATATNGPMKAAEAELRDISGLANGLEGRYDMEFNISVTGDPIPNLPSASTGYQPIAQAEGGDWWVTKPTLFLAGEAGPERAIFVPEGDELPSGAGKGGGGDTYNIINRDKASAALTMAWISQARDKRLNAEMGLS